MYSTHLAGQVTSTVCSQLHRVRARTGKWVRRWMLEGCGCPNNLPARHRSKRGLLDMLSPLVPGQNFSDHCNPGIYSLRHTAAWRGYLYCHSAPAVMPAQSEDSLPGPNCTKQESAMWVLHGLMPMSPGTRTKGRSMQMFPTPTPLRPHPCTAPPPTPYPKPLNDSSQQ